MSFFQKSHLKILSREKDLRDNPELKQLINRLLVEFNELKLSNGANSATN